MLSKDSEIDTEEEKDIVVENFGQGMRLMDRGLVSKKSSSKGSSSSAMSSSVSSVSSKSEIVGRRVMKNRVDGET